MKLSVNIPFKDTHLASRTLFTTKSREQTRGFSGCSLLGAMGRDDSPAPDPPIAVPLLRHSIPAFLFVVEFQIHYVIVIFTPHQSVITVLSITVLYLNTTHVESGGIRCIYTVNKLLAFTIFFQIISFNIFL